MLYKECSSKYFVCSKVHETPLLKAAKQGHTELLSLLLQAGGDPNVADQVIL